MIQLKAAPVPLDKAMVALVPIADINKSRYLAYRAIGFTVMQTARLLGLHKVTIARWRKSDQQFAELETTRLDELRDILTTKAINVDYARNFLLIMEKDRRVIEKSIKLPEELTKGEQEYLLKARGHYTPQQFKALQQETGPLANLPDFMGFVMGFWQESHYEG